MFSLEKIRQRNGSNSSQDYQAGRFEQGLNFRLYIPAEIKLDPVTGNIVNSGDQKPDST